MPWKGFDKGMTPWIVQVTFLYENGKLDSTDRMAFTGDAATGLCKEPGRDGKTD